MLPVKECLFVKKSCALVPIPFYYNFAHFINTHIFSTWLSQAKKLMCIRIGLVFSYLLYFIEWIWKSCVHSKQCVKNWMKYRTVVARLHKKQKKACVHVYGCGGSKWKVDRTAHMEFLVTSFVRSSCADTTRNTRTLFFCPNWFTSQVGTKTARRKGEAGGFKSTCSVLFGDIKKSVKNRERKGKRAEGKCSLTNYMTKPNWESTFNFKNISLSVFYNMKDQGC